MKERQVILAGAALGAACLLTALWDGRIHSAPLGDGSIQYKVAGQGRPAVICEAGLGMDLHSFDPIFDDIAAHTKVFAYTRPGYPGSDATDRPRTVEQAVDDLRKLLTATGVEPPYVLVGHSLGGIYMLHFAHTWPQDTAGVVLVDAPHPDLFHRLRELGVDPRVADKLYWSMPDFARREYDGALNARLSGDVGDIPLIVMTSGDAANNARGPMVQKTHLELLELSTNSRHVYAEHSSHMMLDDVPELVANSVLDLVRSARAKSRQ